MSIVLKGSKTNGEKNVITVALKVIKKIRTNCD